MSFQGLLGGHLRLLRMLLEPPNKSEMFSDRVFPRFQPVLYSHLQENGVLIESSSHFLSIGSNAAVNLRLLFTV